MAPMSRLISLSDTACLREMMVTALICYTGDESRLTFNY